VRSQTLGVRERIKRVHKQCVIPKAELVSNTAFVNDWDASVDEAFVNACDAFLNGTQPGCFGRGASRAIIWTGAADRARAPCTHRFNRHAIPLVCTGELLLSDVDARRQTPPLAGVRAASTTRCMLPVLL